MITITRKFEFDSAHRVLGHEGKCRHLHGHRYVAEVTIQAPELDPLGRVIDFGVVKQIIGGWIDQNWDHNALLHCQDPLLQSRDQNRLFGGRTPYIMAYGNPTAENIASALFHISQASLPSELTVTHVRVYETPNCFADYSE